MLDLVEPSPILIHVFSAQVLVNPRVMINLVELSSVEMEGNTVQKNEMMVMREILMDEVLYDLSNQCLFEIMELLHHLILVKNEKLGLLQT